MKKNKFLQKCSGSIRARLSIAVLGVVLSASIAIGKNNDMTREQQAVMQDLADGEKGGKRYRGPAETWRVEDMTMDELKQRLQQYEAGQRDDRDGYIILNQLWFDYRRQRQENSNGAQQVKAMRLDLLQRHPELKNLRDFQLSERIQYYKKQEEDGEKAAEQTNNWVPPDATPERVMGSGNRLVVVYQFRLEFVELSNDYDLELGGTGHTRLQIFRQKHPVDPAALKPTKSILFKRRFEVFPGPSGYVSTNIMVCTDMLNAYYRAMTPTERQVLQARGQKRTMPWTNPKGNIDQFCGILSLSGDVVYSFPIQQHLPNTLLLGIGITDDGKKAGVMVGQKTNWQGEDGEVAVVGKPREVLIWQEGLGLKRIPVENQNLTWVDLIKKFAAGEF